MTKPSNTIITEDKKSKLTNHLSNLKPLILSHHPDCDKFKNHTFKIRKSKLCIGCFVGYPTAILGILIIWVSNLLNLFVSVHFLSIGISLLSSFILSPLKLTKIKSIKIIQKLLIGIGAAFMFWGVWSLPNPFAFNFLLFFFTFGILIIILNGYHVYGLYRICKKCEYSFDWDACPGFKPIYK